MGAAAFIMAEFLGIPYIKCHCSVIFTFLCGGNHGSL
jgi:TRAP-type uncharacterized transport system fused permease subunit